METIKRILFVCTGNTCRSPMAEYLFKDLLKKSDDYQLQNWEVLSAGVTAVKGAAANNKTKSVMGEININLEDHSSHNISDFELKKEDLIITMTRKHSRALVLRHPDLADKIFTLKEIAELDSDSKDIRDPFGLSEEVYRETRDEINYYLKKLVKKLKNIELTEED